MKYSLSFSTLFLVAFILIGVLMSYTLTILMIRFYTSNYVKRKRDRFSEIIALEVCDFVSQAQAANQLAKVHYFERKILQEQLLESIRSMTGSEKAYLANRYGELGFLDQDLRMSRSYQWEKRLLAVVHLGYLGLDELAPLFLELIEDSQAIVASAAALAFTSLNYSLDNEMLLAKLPAAVFERKDVLSEIMYRISSKEPAVVLRRIMDPDSNPLLKECCIRAILREGSFSVVPILTDFLNQSGMESRTGNADNIAIAILGLRSIGDASACPSVRRYIRHPLPKLRAIAVQMLIEMEDQETLDQIVEIEKDPSIEVQRAIGPKMIPRRTAA